MSWNCMQVKVGNKMRVVKIGGSLLDWPELREVFSKFVSSLPVGQPTLVIVGGGAVVDAIRFYDGLHHWPAQETHWCCVTLMETTASLLHLLFPQWQRLSSPQALHQWLASLASADMEAPPVGSQALVPDRDLVAIVSPAAFYGRDLAADALPANWDTTSDSIAALLASKLDARELILLKSAGSDLDIDPLNRETDLRSLTDANLIDPHFIAVLPKHTHLRLVNLRNTGL